MYLLAFMFFLTSCASIHMDMAGSKSLSPEVQGHIKGSYNISAGQTTRMELDTSNGEVTNPLKSEHGESISLANIELGLFDIVDFVYLSGGDSVGQFGVKVKIFGPSRPMAKAGDSSLSLYVGGGKDSEDDVDEAFVFSTAKADIEAKVMSAGLLYGHRISNQTIIGTSLFYDSYNFNGKFTESFMTPLIGKEFDYDGKVFTLAIYTIFYSRSGWFTRLEAGVQQADWSHTDKVTMGLGSFAFGASF